MHAPLCLFHKASSYAMYARSEHFPIRKGAAHQIQDIKILLLIPFSGRGGVKGKARVEGESGYVIVDCSMSILL